MHIKSALLGVVLSASALAATATSASAYVVCNRDGDCWHTEARVRAPGVRFDVHNDDWYFHQSWNNDKNRHFRDSHPGRGYYRNGLWITF